MNERMKICSDSRSNLHPKTQNTIKGFEEIKLVRLKKEIEKRKIEKRIRTG